MPHPHDMNPELRIKKSTATLYMQINLQRWDTRYVTKTLLIDRWLQRGMAFMTCRMADVHNVIGCRYDAACHLYIHTYILSSIQENYEIMSPYGVSRLHRHYPGENWHE